MHRAVLKLKIPLGLAIIMGVAGILTAWLSGLLGL